MSVTATGDFACHRRSHANERSPALSSSLRSFPQIFEQKWDYSQCTIIAYSLAIWSDWNTMFLSARTRKACTSDGTFFLLIENNSNWKLTKAKSNPWEKYWKVSISLKKGNVSKLAPSSRVLPGFCSMEQLEFLLSLDGKLVHYTVGSAPEPVLPNRSPMFIHKVR